MQQRPREVLARAHELVRAYDIRYVDCFAEDGVLELPFAPAGMPRRVEGREAIRALLEPAYRAAKDAGRRIVEYRDMRFHETLDPEVIVMEFDLVGEQADGRRYELPFVHVVRVRDGKIVHMRDYFDSSAMAERLRVPSAS